MASDLRPRPATRIYKDPLIKIRYNEKEKCWQVHTFFCGSSQYKWINCTATTAKWYKRQGYPNATPASIRVPWQESLDNPFSK